MQKLKSFFLSILYFIVFEVVGIILGAGIGYGVVILNNQGFLASWNPLDGTLNFTSIEDATSQIVWAKATDGKLYSWDTNCYRNTNCDRWIEVKGIPEDVNEGGERDMEKSIDCQSRLSSPKRLPGNVVECARGGFAGPEFGTVVYYALLDNGKIWLWKMSGSMIFDMVMPVFFAFFGIVVGIIAFIVFMIRRARKRKLLSSSSV